jgi:hypothetical protein
MRATCLAHLIFLDLIVLLLLCKEYKLWRSSLCSFLQPPVTSSLLSANILRSTVLSYGFNIRTEYIVTTAWRVLRMEGGREDLQTWRVVANILNKHLLTADKGSFSSLVVGGGGRLSLLTVYVSMLRNVIHNVRVGQII